MKFKEFTKILKENGYEKVRVNGSHFIYKNNAGNLISVPKDLNKMIAARLIKENLLNVG